MSLFNTLGIGGGALRAASAGIDVTSNNVANASNPDHSVQRLRQASSTPITLNGLSYGQGVDLQSVTRATDSIVGSQLQNATGDNAQYAATSRVLTSVEIGFGGVDDGLTAKLGDFFDSLSAATTDPGDTGNRLEVLGALESLVESVNSAATTTEQVVESTLEEMNSLASQVNDALESLASVNAAITSTSSPSPTLYDQRDALARELGESLGATVSIDDKGGATLFVSNHAAVSGPNAREITVEDIDGELRVFLSVDGDAIDVTDGLGGAVGGLADGVAQAREALDGLDAFVVSLADALNTQHAAGYDANGAAGEDMLSYDADAPSLTLSMALDDTAMLAFASGSAAHAGDGGNLSDLITLRDTAVTSGGDTLEDSLRSVVQELGRAVSTADREAELAASKYDDVSSLYDSITGVNLDEEATKLLEYQAAYQAAARVVATSAEMLDELMGIV